MERRDRRCSHREDQFASRKTLEGIEMVALAVEPFGHAGSGTAL